ncbi:hypothetical protein HOLDEFILI_02372 [Holdemania filiformis DSM 12042]|uniref:Uncharacterized protein n=1 Tax=Holdemania filiformis DSM 12042 TaxID=545696 RepID=B9Y967_9FIRM|nr:hypothetical protein HOLDEFILI_02372 [Holdemania filiformis DSM 12042]
MKRRYFKGIDLTVSSFLRLFFFYRFVNHQILSIQHTGRMSPQQDPAWEFK